MSDLVAELSRLEQETASLFETLEWVTENYKRTLAGKPVKDADECLVTADRLIEDWKNKE